LEEPETCDHILWGCEFAQNVWQRASVPTSFRCDVKLSFKEFVAGCIAELQSPALEISFTTAWALWNARNETYWDAKVPIVDEIYGGAAALALDFLENCSKGEASILVRLSMSTDGVLLRWVTTSLTLHVNVVQALLKSVWASLFVTLWDWWQLSWRPPSWAVGICYKIMLKLLNLLSNLLMIWGFVDWRLIWDV
jgi:hypothetical protein